MIATAENPVLYWLLCEEGKVREVYMESNSLVYFRTTDGKERGGGSIEKYFVDVHLAGKSWDITRKEARARSHMQKQLRGVGNDV